MKSVALVLALALLDSARGQVCSTADVECVTAPRTYTCTWPEWAGEQPDDITCEQSSQEAGWGGCNTDSCGGESGGCCNSNRARSCTDDPSEECMMCMQSREDEVACLAPAVPEVAMCPEGTTLDADATTGSIGECVHECHDHSTWSQVDNHICFALTQDSSFDWSNNTCGVGNCDTHTTPDACAASDGYWRDEEMFSEQTCPAIQGVLSWVSYASGREGGRDMAGMMALQALVQVGETCCSGFDAETFLQCSTDDMPYFVRLCLEQP